MSIQESILDELKTIGSAVDKKMEVLLTKDLTEGMKELVLYQIKVGGKRVRPALSILFAQAVENFSAIPEPVLDVAAGVELIHNYSLILDDIIDRGDIRRNMPTTRKKFGDEMAILAGMIYREAIFESAADFSKYYPDKAFEVLSRYSKAIKILTEGERLDILFEQTPRDFEYFKQHQYKYISKQDYFTMIEYKTAILLTAACELGVLAQKNSITEQLSAAHQYGWNLGMAFQIVDDLLDLFAKDKQFGKEIGKDIKEGKLGNFVVLSALEELPPPKQTQLRQILVKKEKSPDDIETALNLIRTTTAEDTAKALAHEYKDKALQALKEHFSPSVARNKLEALAEFIVNRNY